MCVNSFNEKLKDWYIVQIVAKRTKSLIKISLRHLIPIEITSSMIIDGKYPSPLVT
jgi:hypothetical protein